MGRNGSRKDPTLDNVLKAKNTFHIRDLKKYFEVEKGFFGSIFGSKDQKFLKAVDGISLHIKSGEVLGLAGESGCGKTTVAKTLVGLYKLTAGDIVVNKTNITNLIFSNRKKWSLTAQYIFQNPYDSLNPRQTVLDAVIEGLKIHHIGSGKDRVDLATDALERVKLLPPRDFLERYPHQLSGGQRQRVSIARALVLNPKLLVADEPVSMLDVSIRAGIINLIQELTVQMSLASLFISHDISTLRYICNRIAIMYLGKIVEIGPIDEVINKAFHPYTQLLISAIPVPDPESKRRRIILGGEVPSPIDVPEGCRFVTRCNQVIHRCKIEEPEEIEVGKNHYVWCHKI